MSVIDMLMTLVAGGCICIPSEHDRMNNLAEVIRSMDIDCCCLTPSVANTLKGEKLPSLRTLVLGGEAVRRDHLEGWADMKNLQLINAYGPAEGSVCVAGPAIRDYPAVIGRAVGSVSWIVNPLDHCRLLPIGAVGELLTEGPLLARGYLNDPEKTATAFIEHPPWLAHDTRLNRPKNISRLYKTGDLCRYNEDGTIEYIGRKDTQIKLRGQRIEIREIEHHLRSCLPPKVAFAVDLITPVDTPNSPKLAVFLEVSEPEYHGTHIEPTDEIMSKITPALEQRLAFILHGVDEKLKGSLPAYMVPSVYIPVTRIPLMASQKTDRKRLVRLGSNLSNQRLLGLSALRNFKNHIHLEAGSMGIHGKMKSLWAKLLNIEAQTVGEDDDFFRLGGDSINVIQLVGAARAVEIILTAETIFRHSTLAAMSSMATFNTAAGVTPEQSNPVQSFMDADFHQSQKAVRGLRLPLERSEIEDIVETTDIQARMVAGSLLKNHGRVNYFAFDIKGPIDTNLLQKSCGFLVNRHQILRTIFSVHDEKVLQVILKCKALNFKLYKSRRATKELLETLCNIDLKCGNDPLSTIAKFMLVTREAEDHTLIMRLTHHQFDGISLHILYRELQAAYHYNELGLLPVLQFSDYARAVKGNKLEEARSYWRSFLKGSSQTSILQHSKPSYRNVLNDTVARNVPYVSLQSYGITYATIVKAAWAYVLAELSMKSDVVFGNTISGRNISLEGVERVVGPCNDSIPVRVKLEESSTVLELLHQIRDQQLAAIPHELLGVTAIVEQCTDWPRWARWGSSVNHQNYANADENHFKLGEAQCRVSYAALELDRIDMMVYSHLPRDNEVKIELTFCNTAIRPSGMLNKLCNVIQQFSSDVQAPLVLPFTSNPSPPPTTSSPHPLIPIPIPPPQTNTNNTTTPLHTHTVNHHHHHHSPPKPHSFTFDLIDPHALVNRVWTRFQETNPHPRNNNNMPERELTPDTPYYDIWGELVYAAYFAALYRQEGGGGIEIAMEDIIEYPTMRSQMEYLTETLGLGVGGI